MGLLAGRRFWQAFLLTLAVFFLLPGISAAAGFEDDIIPLSVHSEIAFFYSDTCSSCHRALPFVENISSAYPDVVFRFYDTSKSAVNLTLFAVYCEEYDHPYSGIPVVFAGESEVYVGYSAISMRLENTAVALSGGNVSLISSPEADTPSAGFKAEQIPLYAVAFAGLLDGINPCAFSVLILLLVSLTGMDSRRKMATAGAVYILAVFIFYLLSGLGIFALVRYSETARIFSIIAVIFAFSAGAAGIISIYKDSRALSPTIPQCGRRVIGPFIRKATIPGAFILGIAAGVFELPCTGGIYLAILALLSRSGGFEEALVSLLVYNAFFILPLVAILLGVVYGLPPGRMDEWRRERKVALRLIMSIVLICMGAVVLFYSVLGY